MKQEAISLTVWPLPINWKYAFEMFLIKRMLCNRYYIHSMVSKFTNPLNNGEGLFTRTCTPCTSPQVHVYVFKSVVTT